MTASETATESEVSSLAASLLIGAWIVAIEYWRTGWNITFAVEAEHPAVRAGLLEHPFEIVLSAAQVSVSDARAWGSCLAAAPVDIAARGDSHDALAAFLLFNSVAYSVTEARANERGDLLLCFEGDRTLIVYGLVRGSEDEWSVAAKCAQPRVAIIGAEAGHLYASSAARLAFEQIET